MIDIKHNHGHLSFVRRHPPISKLSSRTFLLSASVALFPFILMVITMMTMMMMSVMMITIMVMIVIIFMMTRLMLMMFILST